MSAHHPTIEHIVLLNIKPDVDSSKVTTMIHEINGLAQLDLTLHLTSGKLIPSTLHNFSHIIHCRYSSTENLQAYYTHPKHLKVAEYIQQLIDDVVVVDWVSNATTGSLKPGSAMRVTLLKVKEGLTENEKGKVVEGMKSQIKSSEEISIGESFAHEMAKGYSIAMIAVFPGPVDLEALDSDAELAKLLKPEVKDFLESQIVVDYVIPSP